MKIAFIGKFERMDDEEYIALGFEANNCEVFRIEDSTPSVEICSQLHKIKPDLVLWAKLRTDAPQAIVDFCKKEKYKTACWVFDLYFGYHREYQLTSHPAFKADYVFTTDGGHQKEFEAIGINHHCVRQGIANAECFIDRGARNPRGLVFVGTDNPNNPYRTEMITATRRLFPDLEWVGRGDPRQVRGKALNKLYGEKFLVIGDSVFSPHYWSNRIVETLGRGGCLIHPDVPGLKEEYPFLLTYERGNWLQLTNLITSLLGNPSERNNKVVENFEWVRDHYTVDKKCAELLSYIK